MHTKTDSGSGCMVSGKVELLKVYFGTTHLNVDRSLLNKPKRDSFFINKFVWFDCGVFQFITLTQTDWM